MNHLTNTVASGSDVIYKNQVHDFHSYIILSELVRRHIPEDLKLTARQSGS